MEGDPVEMEGITAATGEPEQQEQPTQPGSKRVSPFTFQPGLLLADMVNMVGGGGLGRGCRATRHGAAPGVVRCAPRRAAPLRAPPSRHAASHRCPHPATPARQALETCADSFDRLEE